MCRLTPSLENDTCRMAEHWREGGRALGVPALGTRVSHFRTEAERAFPLSRQFSCWNPTRVLASFVGVPEVEAYARKTRGVGGHAGADGPAVARRARSATRLRHREAHRADQRRDAGHQSRDALPGADKARAGGVDCL